MTLGAAAQTAFLLVALWGAAPSADASTLRYCEVEHSVDSAKIRCKGAYLEGISSLDRFRKLEELNFTRSTLKSLSGFPALPRLQRLSLNLTKLVSLAGVGRFSGLEELDLSNTQVTRLAPLAALKELRILAMWNVAASDLTPLRALKKVEDLVLGGTRVTRLEPLAGLRELRSLNIENTKVARLAPLKGLPHLTYLHLAQTPVSAAELGALLSSMPKLRVYGCGHGGPFPCVAPALPLPRACLSLLACCTAEALAKPRAGAQSSREFCAQTANIIAQLTVAGKPGLPTLQRVCRERQKRLEEENPAKWEMCRVRPRAGK